MVLNKEGEKEEVVNYCIYIYI